MGLGSRVEVSGVCEGGRWGGCRGGSRKGSRGVAKVPPSEGRVLAVRARRLAGAPVDALHLLAALALALVEAAVDLVEVEEGLSARACRRGARTEVRMWCNDSGKNTSL